MVIFCPLTLPPPSCPTPPQKNTWKIRILKKWKNCWRCHHFTQVHQKPQSYEVQFWLLRYRVRHRIFCHFWPFFALLPPNNPENQNFEKMKKASGDIILLHICIINEDHMMYGSSDKRYTWLFFALWPS